MSDQVIDHEARRIAQQAHDRIEQHEKFCVERTRRAETFEGDMRVGMTNLGTQIQSTVGRVHGRIDMLIRGALFGCLAIIVSGVSWFLVAGLP